MTKLHPKLRKVVYKSPVKCGAIVLAESFTFPPLLPGIDSHGQTKVRVNFKVSLNWN